jgi:ATP-dependent 26S proteasome regulatory subunit
VSTPETNLILLPAQAEAFAALQRGVESHNVAVLRGRPGAGKTTILQSLYARLGGTLITSREIIELSLERHPLSLEETVYSVLKKALAEHDTVIVDDFQFIGFLSCCTPSYPRMNFLAAALVPLVALAQATGKKLIFAADQMPIPGLYDRVPASGIPVFTIDDYRALLVSYLGHERAAAIDVRKVHRFAPTLTARQLTDTCNALRDEETLSTDRFIQYLREHHMASNVDLGEVQAVDLKDLKGLDAVLDALEANVILPLEKSELAEELDLKPKRGVLLAGPPGTGKTTIGRALAHRLKSKFFLIDGTVISGTSDFYGRIHRIFEAAKHNAPAIIFIDDSDVIFETGSETGLYRYLLTMLDGLESESAGRICLIMTAMDVGSMPPALVRSGRIELWLETTLPSEDARTAILADHCAKLPAAIGEVDLVRLARDSEGLSGADLKRVVEDGKLLFAYDRARDLNTGPATEYFVRAMETVRQNRQAYAEAEARARMRHPVRPPYFDAFSSMEGFASVSTAHGFGFGMLAPADVESG